MALTCHYQLYFRHKRFSLDFFNFKKGCILYQLISYHTMHSAQHRNKCPEYWHLNIAATSPAESMKQEF